MTWTASNPRLGVIDINAISTTTPGISALPSATPEDILGEIVSGWDSTYGGGEFIYLKTASATAIPLGTLCYWTNNYVATAVPAGSTSKSTGLPVAVPIQALASSTTIQYTWFQIQGKVPVLKTAVTVAANVPVYISGTAGRVKVLSSAGQTILGAFSANASSVTSTTSTVLVFLNRSSLMGA